MSMFNRWFGQSGDEPRGQAIESDTALDGQVLTRITIDRINRQERKVKAIVMRYSDGKTVFKLRYSTEKSEQRAYEDVRAQLKAFMQAEDYIEKNEIHNVDNLPTVRTTKKRSR